MTREEMIKVRWRPYMSIDYQSHGMKEAVECMLIAIDFDAEILTLAPLDQRYVNRELYANLKYCSIPKRMKVAVIEGKKVIERKGNTLKARKIDLPGWEEEDEYDNAS